MLQVCDDGHDYVCYEVRDCPVCKLQQTVLDSDSEIYALKDEIRCLEDRFRRLGK